MTNLTIYKDQDLNATIISNQFIDEYMVAANDAQIKIYLYLVRMTSANLPFSISDIADRFNYTEKDILRALRYWEKQKLLSLDYDGERSLKAVHILPFPSLTLKAEILPLTPKAATVSEPVLVSPKASKVSASKSVPIVREAFSADDLNAFQNDNETAQIIFIAEQYTGKILSRNDLEILLFIYTTLGFSTDLIDYLIQYCVERGKKQFSYMEKVAIDWAQSHITTVRQAKLRTAKYEKQVYSIMRALGKSAAPTEPEIAFIKKWTTEMGFPMEIILKACERAVLATDHNRFPYANAILVKWQEAGVKSLKDIEALDNSYQKTSSASSRKDGGFNDFGQRSYDYDALEKMLLSN
ncbi:MAG: DnaD domain protein [Lachnoclostridium sp.]|nr:DnaD domain protein [Lachnoclostridium sp.]